MDDIQSKYLSMELEGVRGVLNLLATEFDRMNKAKKEGRPIVGTWLNTPAEILLAANAYPTTYRFEDLHRDIIKGREDLRQVYDIFNMDQCFCLDVCRSMGSPVMGASRKYDLVVTDFTPKLPIWEDILKKYVAEKVDLLPLEIPRGLDEKEAEAAIRERLVALRTKLEEITGREITDEDIKEACEKTNRVREYVVKIDELARTNPMPIRGGDIWYAYFPMSSCYIGGEVDKTREFLASLYDQIAERIEKGVKAYDNGTKRICAIPSGSNLTHETYPLMEKLGGALVTDWPCCEHGGKLFRDPIEITKDPMDGLARHYLKTFGIFDPAQDARDILEMVDRLSVDAVVYDLQPDLFGYAPPVESVDAVREVLAEKGVPMFVHNGLDPEGFKAFLESC